MASFRIILRPHILSIFKGECLPKSTVITSKRFLNYTAIPYEKKHDPASLFFDENVQEILKKLTRVDINKVYKRRKTGRATLSDPVYKFMTDEELKEAIKDAQHKCDDLLQIPPVVSTRDPRTKIISSDPALKDLDTSRLVFTDITYGVKDSERLIVVREIDGTLREAEWDLRRRMNQIYFPLRGREFDHPQMFQDNHLEDLLNRHEYVFVLDCACINFEPDDPEYQRIASVTYQHVNDHHQFDILRSTRHFGSMTFFLAWNKIIDNLLLELIETMHLNEAATLLDLYSNIHKIEFQGSNELERLQDFADKCSSKKGALELAIQAYKDVTCEKAVSQQNS